MQILFRGQNAYPAVKVNGITPTGTKSITTNGTHDVTQYASASVNVPNPSTGALNITANGTYDVTDKASAVVNVQGGGLISSVTVVQPITDLFTISSEIEVSYL